MLINWKILKSYIKRNIWQGCDRSGNDQRRKHCLRPGKIQRILFCVKQNLITFIEELGEMR